jgi:hypothetical protein
LWPGDRRPLTGVKVNVQMRHQAARETTKAALKQELEALSERGAGVAELLDHVQNGNRRVSRRQRLSRLELDELARYCWTLQQRKPTGLLWGKARELWGGATPPRPALQGRLAHRSARPQR